MVVAAETETSMVASTAFTWGGKTELLTLKQKTNKTALVLDIIIYILHSQTTQTTFCIGPYGVFATPGFHEAVCGLEVRDGWSDHVPVGLRGATGGGTLIQKPTQPHGGYVAR